jgi:hypothetical protein
MIRQRHNGRAIQILKKTRRIPYSQICWYHHRVEVGHAPDLDGGDDFGEFVPQPSFKTGRKVLAEDQAGIA